MYRIPKATEPRIAVARHGGHGPHVVTAPGHLGEDPAVVSLTDPVALRVYAHPLRMALVGLLRREGPLTATQAAKRLGKSVPNCSFHLRMLAKYGLVERAEAADAREKPWRAAAEATSSRSDTSDPRLQAAIDHLEATVVDRYAERARVPGPP